MNGDKWEVIEVGWELNPYMTKWCVYHPPGPPNSNMPSMTDRNLAVRVAALLNFADHRIPLDVNVTMTKPEGT